MTVLPKEWRSVPWGVKERDLKFVKEYQPHDKEVQLRFMLYGPSGAGKSRFINSVESALRGEISDRAGVDAISHGSFTTKYKAYQIQKGGPRTYYPFVFNDIMGLEKDASQGARVEDIKGTREGWLQFQSSLYIV
ncbi:Interferon-induced protein 44-like [Dissostichus eleginoides]|uniref:Interferon-induced protein 44-like n=1 Tax=Dissostichus eleginoides TaxID=100907 RepID=A0AAD9ETP8_DISEL|nr:Interferon-induced protein 44-like [Dissostichus eleginoides]